MKYFVSYRTMTDGGYGFGRAIVTSDGPITDIEDIEAIEGYIAAEHGTTAVLLLFFKELPEEV